MDLDPQFLLDIAAVLPLLRCPATGEALTLESEDALQSAGGRHRYPILGGIPALIDPERSLFDPTPAPEEAAGAGSSGFAARAGGAGWRVARRVVPDISLNVRAERNIRRLRELIVADAGGERPRVLVLAGAVVGEGMAELLADPRIDTIESDVVVGPRTQILADAHDLPFADASFDAVVAQAMLGYVGEPERVVGEIHRVLKPEGVVYSETNFLQGVHMGPYDLTRHTHLGHRRLFRWFDEVDSGVQCGPGMSLAWAFVWFAMALAGRSRIRRAAARGLAPFFVFWLKYLDRVLAETPGGYDAASGTFFLGRRRATPVSDREVMMGYRGGNSTRWLAARPEQGRERG